MNQFLFQAAPIGISLTDPLGGKVDTISDVVLNTLNIVMPISGMLFVGMFVYAGITYTTSSGDPGKVKSAQAMMSNAVIGFVITAAAFVILRIVEKALGIK